FRLPSWSSTCWWRADLARSRICDRARATMTEPRFVRIALRIATIAILSFIYLPIVVLVIYAFNSSKIQTWPPVGFTLEWFADAASNPAIIAALKNSLIAASVATTLALALGTLAAMAV